MSKNGSATKGFAILSAAGILNKILSVLYVPVLLQIIGDLGYGIYSAGYRIYVFIYVLTNSGFPIGISKLQAELLAHENYRDARRSIKIIRLLLGTYGLTMAAITAIFAKQITTAIGYERSYLVILALAPTMFFSAISSSYRGFFNGNSNMKPTAMSQVIEQFLNVVLSLGFALLLKPYGLEIACAGATVGTTLGSLGSALYLHFTFKRNKKSLNKKTPDDIERIRGKFLVYRLLSYAIPIAFNSIVIYGGDLVDLWNTKLRLIAAGFSSADATIKYGVLSKYSQLLNVPLAITAAMHIAVIPSFSTAIAMRDFKLLKSYFSEAFKTTLMISIPAAVGLGVLSKPVYLMLFSEKYVDGWKLMAMGSVVIVLVSIIQIQSGILQSFNRTRLATLSMMAGILVKIFINYFLIAIPSINISGAVIGTIVCYIVAMYINSKNIRKFSPVPIVIKKHMGRPVVASAAMGVVVAVVFKIVCSIMELMLSPYFANALSTIIAIVAGVICYGIIMFRIGGITTEDLDNIPYAKKLMKYIPASILSLAKPR